MIDDADAAVDDLRRKARRRLVGAVVLALGAAILIPLLFEKDPKPLGEAVSIQIPPIDDSKFVSRLSVDNTSATKSDAKSAPAVGPAPRSDVTGDLKSSGKAEGKDARVDGKADAAKDTKADARSNVQDAKVGDKDPKANSKADTKDAKRANGKAEVKDAKSANANDKPDAKDARGANANGKADAKDAKGANLNAKTDAKDAKGNAKGNLANAKSEPKVEQQSEAKSDDKDGMSESPGATTNLASASPPSTSTVGIAPEIASASPAATTDAHKADTGPAEGFVVQLAAFTDDKGANALANRLKKSGYAAYTEPVDTARGRMWRVRVGGYPSRADARAAAAKLKAEGHKGIVAAAK